MSEPNLAIVWDLKCYKQPDEINTITILQWHYKGYESIVYSNVSTKMFYVTLRMSDYTNDVKLTGC